MPGGVREVPIRPWWSYGRRLRIHRATTESLLTDRRTSFDDPENEQDDYPMATAGDPAPAKTVPDFVRDELRWALHYGRGCLRTLDKPRSCGNVEWHPDALNAANARLAYKSIDRGHLDDRIETGRLFSAPRQWLTNLRVLCGDRWYVDANQLLLARELGIISKLPKVSAERVSDLNKQDIFVKLLAISQIIWLCFQLSMRLSQGVPTTQLEVMTIGYALCSAITYVMLFDRPKDVTTVFEIEAASYPTSDEMSLVASTGPDTFGMCRSTVSIPNNSTHQNKFGLERALSISFAVILFGSLRFAAWDYEFPTSTERTLWRMSTVLTFTTMPTMANFEFLVRQFNAIFNSNPRGRPLGFEAGLHSYILAQFIAARLFILVEVIRSLAYQPPGSYKTTWAAYVPHVG